jgi:phosphate transport system protein
MSIQRWKMSSPQSPRETFDRQLNHMLHEVLALGSMVEEAVRRSVESLKQRDMDTSRQVYKDDQHINIKRYEIEQNCLTLIATQQPMARDLRLLAAILEIITELERIGDYAKGIARINILLGDEPPVKPLIDIPKMADQGLDMLRRSLDAFIRRDAEAARKISDEDDIVDDLYNDVYRELIDIMIANPESLDRATYLIWVAHNLERLADRVTNICERIVFVVTGEIMELDRTDDEMASIE